MQRWNTLIRILIPRRCFLKGDLSELLQHEYDHLDGILATMRGIDNKSLYMQQMKRELT